jgi:hypothetical protein
MNSKPCNRRRRSLLLAAMAGMAGAASPVGAQHAAGHQHHTPGKASRRARAELGLSGAIDRDGKLWVASSEAEGDMQFLALRTSVDGGRTWSAAQAAQRQEPVAAGGESRPKIALGSKGEIFIAYTRPIARPHIGDIRFLRSLDHGRSFSEPLTVHANRDVTTHSFESMIVDREGRIFIAWIDGRDADAAKARGERYAGSAIYYAVSDDGGASFRGDYKIADHSCECCRIGLSLDPRGRPVAFWRHVFAPNIRDHALATLDPAGAATPLTRTTFDDWRIDACPHHGPALAYGPDGVRHQVWFNGDERGGVQYLAVPVKGATPAAVAIGNAQAAHADVAVQGRRIAIVWKQAGDNVTAILARTSEDSGKSWHQAEMARTAGDSSKPYLVAGPSGMIVLWRTEEDGIRTIHVGGASGRKT